ncbi:Ribonuclease T2 precursor (RNase T2) [Elasticomyces elasticus]|nr:Ribonuclease T2 precursor (RNase T2) [Elasticomyces elasticus]
MDVLHNAPDAFADFWPNAISIMPSSLPSIRTIAKAAVVGVSQVLLGADSSCASSPGVCARSNVIRGAAASCPSPQLSCHNTTAVANLCCFNAPGGQLLQTQFWDTAPATGPSDSWTVHGLWPDHCDGTYDATCDPSRAYTNIAQILQRYGATDLLSYMQTYWKDYQGNDESFWEHEWSKHGTCISTLETSCYTNYQPQEEVVDFFQKTVDLFKNLTSYAWLSEAGIVPSSSATYTSAAIETALEKYHGHPVTIGCKNGQLNEIWYHFDVLGSVQTGTFVAADPDGTKSTCPRTGVKYLPKSGSAGPTATTTTTTTRGGGSTPTAAPTATSTNVPFSGRGNLMVQTGGSQKGCIISGGTWYTSGTCASFTATTTGDAITLSSSKGNCAVVNGALTCASTVSTASVFDADGALLGYAGNTTFYATAVPRGSTQGTVYTEKHATSLQISWQSI